MMSMIANTTKMEILLAALKRLKKKVEEVMPAAFCVLQHAILEIILLVCNFKVTGKDRFKAMHQNYFMTVPSAVCSLHRWESLTRKQNLLLYRQSPRRDEMFLCLHYLG